MARLKLSAKGRVPKARPRPVPKLDATLRRNLRATGAAMGLAAPDVAKGKGNSYEAWVMFQLANRLRSFASVVACDHQANRLRAGRRFKARGGPGHIRPAGRPERNAPCHFLVVGSRRHLEIHLDIEHLGASNETHELDISVVDSRDASAVRALPRGGPFSARRCVALELKAYDEAAMLSPGFARALFGVRSDLEVRSWPFGIAATVRNGGLSLVMDPSEELYWLLTTADLSKGYLARYHLEGERYVWPGHNEQVLDQIADAIAAVL